MQKTTQRRLLLKSALCAVPAMAGISSAFADTYPSRAVKLVVPFAPGGSTDGLARTVATLMTAHMKQAFIVDNKPGANSTIGARSVLAAPADGYTLLAVGGTGATDIFNPKASAIDLLTDFAPVIALVQGAFGIFANASLPVSNIAELIAYAKANSGKLNYGMSSPTTTLFMEAFKAKSGIDIAAIPYKGSGPNTIALLANEVQVSLDNPISMMPHVKAGKIKALGIGATQRMKAFPDLPLISDALPGFHTLYNTGIWVKAGTPPDIIAKLNLQLGIVLQSAEVQDQIYASGGYPTGGTPAAFLKYIQAELDVLSNAAQAINYKPT